jgi:hypothetical protein
MHQSSGEKKKIKERDVYEEPRVDWKILLKCNLNNYVGRVMTAFTRFGIGSIVVLV